MTKNTPFVKQNEYGVLGLFADQPYDPGQVILHEVKIRGDLESVTFYVWRSHLLLAASGQHRQKWC